MAPMPLPGANEAELIAKVGTGVVRGLRSANQVPPWPDAHDGLLELHEILRDWSERAEETSRYARQRVRARRDQAAHPPAAMPAPSQMGATNAAPFYVERAVGDAETVLTGRVPALLRLRRSRKRQAARRGLRTILGVYCPDLLAEFERAAEARLAWVQAHRADFDRWFDRSRSDAEVDQLVAEMTTTSADLRTATEQLREFITANYPLPGANPHR